MNPEIIASYFQDFREVAKKKDVYFYCCNRIEKTFPDGTKAKFFDYPWSKSDEIILDEFCPWHQEYYSVFPPMYRKYDGLHQHRFIKVSSNE